MISRSVRLGPTLPSPLAISESMQSDLQCRWHWCRNTYPSTLELLEHVRDHVRHTLPCYVRDIPVLVRAEEGIGESMSGLTMNFNGYSQSPQDSCAPSTGPHLPPDISITNAVSPVQLPAEVSNTRPRVQPPASTSSLAHALSIPVRPNVSTPPPAHLRHTPKFVTLGSTPEPAGGIPNPDFPDLDTLIALAGKPRHDRHSPFGTPNQRFSRETPGSQDSDRSVERHLTQGSETSYDDIPKVRERSDSSGRPQDQYAGELNWADESAQRPPLWSSQTSQPSQSPQSQSQPSPGLPRQGATSRRQPWYQSPTRVPLDSRRLSPASGVVQDGLGSPSTAERRTSSPTKTYISGSLKILSPPSDRPNKSYGGTLNPSVLSHSPSPGPSSSQIEYSFVPLTQAPLPSQSMSQ
ncbi:hypothetical protein GGX14DRAFT_613155 [Mycena pura]|uniref:C2H2-type domain-containing protein n=1 Tax=Mycena pura TaxID=153505 RepID=A0AAD7E567_9AGAR|nr:hypothetical protein GGX14DRAFT_613155 [Mycena pura]